MDNLGKAELERYSRNILLAGFGRAGQARLKRSRVVVVGAGGLGSPLLYYLAAAGVGEITIFENDVVEPGNLNRQILFGEADIGRSKLEVAGERLRQSNPHIEVRLREERFGLSNYKETNQADLLIEGSDNFATKFFCNDVAFFLRKPLISGGILRFDGQWFCARPGESYCLRCIYREMPPEDAVPNCAQAGVIGALAGVVGAAMALEAIKYLALPDYAEEFPAIHTLNGNPWKNRVLKRQPSEECVLCGGMPRVTELLEKNYPGLAGTDC